jgi:hypothetical protein
MLIFNRSISFNLKCIKSMYVIFPPDFSHQLRVIGAGLEKFSRRISEHEESYNGGSSRAHKRTPIEASSVTAETSEGSTSSGEGGTDGSDGTGGEEEGDGGSDDPDRRRLPRPSESFSPQQVLQLQQIIQPLLADLVGQALGTNAAPPSQFLCGVAQVSKQFNIPEGTIRKHLRDIKHSKRGKRLYFHSQDVIDWINQGRRATADEVEAATALHLQSLRRTR